MLLREHEGREFRSPLEDAERAVRRRRRGRSVFRLGTKDLMLDGVEHDGRMLEFQISAVVFALGPDVVRTKAEDRG